MIIQRVQSVRTIQIIVVALLLIVIGLVVASRGDIESNAKRKMLASNLGVSSLDNISFENIPGIVKHLLYQTPGVSIDVKFLDLATLLKDRERALNLGILQDPSWVPATISYLGNTFAAKVSLKGDLKDHWINEDQFSIKVKLDNGFINGHERFSIQAPSTRQFPDNDIFLSFARTNDVLANSMFYLPVAFNGKNWGIMNIEPTVDKYFLELAGQKDSLALKFDDQVEWNYRIKSAEDQYVKAYKVFDSLFDVNIMQRKAFLKQEFKQQQFSYLLNMLRLEDKKILDEVKFCKAIVLSEIWNNQHALHKSNTRYFFNPYTLRLEPILSDQGDYTKILSTTHINSPKLYHLDERFGLIANDKNASYRDCIASAFKSINAQMVGLEDITEEVHLQFPNDSRYNIDILKSNIDFIVKNFDAIFFAKLTSPTLDTVPRSLTHNQLSNMNTWVGLQQFDDGTIWLLNRLPIKIKLLEISNGVEQYVLTDEEQILHPQDKLLSGYSTKNFIAKPRIFQTKFVNKHEPIVLKFEVDGLQREQTSKIILPSYKNIKNPLDSDPNVILPSFIQLEGNQCKITKNQTVIVKKPLILNCQLVIEGGVNLKFRENTYLVVKGGLVIGNLDTEPVTMGPISSRQKWKGVYVLGKGSDVKIQNMKVSDVLALTDGLLNLTGALNFYETNLTIEKLDIENSLAEDALNVINSDFQITNVSIINTISDAIDLDFSDGSLSKLDISKIGGDAIDLSGSTVAMLDINVTGVRDKALSIGESSKIEASNINIAEAGVGIAVKDGSSALIHDVNMSENYHYDYMTYIKKAFYETPSLYLSDEKGCNFRYSRSENSQFFCNNVPLSVLEENIPEIYRSGFMQKDN